MRTRALVAALVIYPALANADGDSPYLFYTFDNPAEFPAGTLENDIQGLLTIEPEATVAEETAPHASRHLSVTGAIVLSGKRFTGNGKTHLEVWVRPQSVAVAEGTEFLDYDGAAVALFRTGQGHAELHALHISEKDKGFWVSTGQRISIDEDGRAISWHRLHIIQHWEKGRWDLALDGMPVLEGLGRGASAQGRDFELWFYGQGAQAANAFDDVLICALSPDLLESHLARTRTTQVPTSPPPLETEKRVTRQTTESSRRQKALASENRPRIGRAKILNIQLQVIGGGRHIGEFESKDPSGQPQNFALYTPGYDEDGKPKPLEIQIRCDAELEEGASLEQIQWAITEHSQDPAQNVRVIVHGTFANGPSLIAEVPSEWSNKPLAIRCGKLQFQKRSR